MRTDIAKLFASQEPLLKFSDGTEPSSPNVKILPSGAGKVMGDYGLPARLYGFPCVHVPRQDPSSYMSLDRLAIPGPIGHDTEYLIEQWRGGERQMLRAGGSDDDVYVLFRDDRLYNATSVFHAGVCVFSTQSALEASGFARAMSIAAKHMRHMAARVSVSCDADQIRQVDLTGGDEDASKLEDIGLGVTG